MREMFKSFMIEEDGMGTVEIVIIVAVLVGVALLFSGYIKDFVKRMLVDVFKIEVAPDAIKQN